MSTVWIAEKPDVGRRIGSILGVKAKLEGALECQGNHFVTWGFGHLLEQLMPEDYDASLKTWNWQQLPFVPSTWKLQPADGKAQQVKVIRTLLAKAQDVVIATDIGREGELIARELITYLGYKGPIKRLWANDINEGPLRKAMAALLPGDSKLPNYYSALARQQADYVLGLNLTRAMTLAFATRGAKRVGRVQTPTLALVVRRDQQIAAFQSRDYFDLKASCRTSAGTVLLHFRPADEQRLFDRGVAEALARNVTGFSGPLHVRDQHKRKAPPPPFSTKTLQQQASTSFGFDPDKTLKVAQALYDAGLITYPRSENEYLPPDQKDLIPGLIAILKQFGPTQAAAAAIQKPVVRDAIYDASRVGEHHAIVPSSEARVALLSGLQGDELKLYTVIANRYLATLYPDYEYSARTVAVAVPNGPTFEAKADTPLVQGWKAIYASQAGAEEETDADDGTAGGEAKAALERFSEGMPARLESVQLDAKKTRPPPAYTIRTLLEDMEHVGRFVTDPAVRKFLYDAHGAPRGIGTGATRASIIKGLFDSEYLVKVKGKGQRLASTPLAQELIAHVPDEVSDAAMTAMWEGVLEDIAAGKRPGQAGAREFLDRLTQKVREWVGVLHAQAQAIGMRGAEVTRNPPTKKMMQLASQLADQHKLKGGVPREVRDSFDACKAFIDKYLPPREAAAAGAATTAPTEKQLEFARKLAARNKLTLPPDALTDRQACSRFIDAQTGGGSAPRTTGG